MNAFSIAANNLAAKATLAAAAAVAAVAPAQAGQGDYGSMQISASRSGITIGGDNNMGPAVDLWKGGTGSLTAGFSPRYYLGSLTDGIGHTGLGVMGVVSARIRDTSVGAVHLQAAAGPALTYTHKDGGGTARPLTSVWELRLGVERKEGEFLAIGLQTFGNDSKARPTITFGATFP